MADFSKQWCEINDPEMPHDFDIWEEFDKLEPNTYVRMICEGFGFGAIANINGKCNLFMPHDDPTGITNGTWVDYDRVIE